MMDKPPKQGAKIINLFPERKVPPPTKRLGAKVIDLSAVRRDTDGVPGISSDAQEGAQIVEFPDAPSKIRQKVSELIKDTTARERDRSEGDDEQDYKKIAEEIAELLDRAYKRPDDKPGDNSTKELGVCILTLTVFNTETIGVLDKASVLAELERIISLSRRPTHPDRRAASMAEVAWQQLTYKPEDTEDNTDPEPPSIA